MALLKELSVGILEELNISDSEFNDLISAYSEKNQTSSFNIKRAFKNMRDPSFKTFVHGVLPIQEYKLTLEVKRDGHTYTTEIGEKTVLTKDYIQLGNTTCYKVNTPNGVTLVDINTAEYLEIIDAYEDQNDN